jgi:hypothetical protein
MRYETAGKNCRCDGRRNRHRQECFEAVCEVISRLRLWRRGPCRGAGRQVAGTINVCLHAAGRCCHTGLRPAPGRDLSGSDEMPPEPLDAAIIFATVGDLLPLALKAVSKGGRVVCASIRHPELSLSSAMGREAARVGRQSQTAGWNRFSESGSGDRHRHPYHNLSAQPGQSSPRRSPRWPVRRRGSSRAMSAGAEGSDETCQQ